MKYVMLEGEGVQEGVTFCERGRRVRSMWRHTYKLLSYIWNLRL